MRRALIRRARPSPESIASVPGARSLYPTYCYSVLSRALLVHEITEHSEALFDDVAYHMA